MQGFLDLDESKVLAVVDEGRPTDFFLRLFRENLDDVGLLMGLIIPNS